MSESAVTSAPLALTRSPRRVLVVVTRRIGDVLLATPVLRSIRDAWPQASVDALVFSGTQGFLTGNPDVTRVLTVAERPGFGAHLSLAATLARRYDLALSLLPGDRPTIYAWLAGKKRVGLLEPDRKSRWKRSLLDAWVPFDNRDTHTVRAHLALLSTIGVSPKPNVVASWTPEDERVVERLLSAIHETPYAVLHPFPKFRYKMWTEAGWIAVARWLGERGLRVVLTGGPDADEREYVARIAKHIRDPIDLSGRLSVGGTAFVVSKAAVYVGADTAITHAAAALGVPTVALFGPTNPVKWGPWPAGQAADTNPWVRTGSQTVSNVRLVQGSGNCVPCGLEGCERHIASTSDCLTSLPPQRVIAAIEDLIG